jgi:hypothetical protein
MAHVDKDPFFLTGGGCEEGWIWSGVGVGCHGSCGQASLQALSVECGMVELLSKV